MITTLVNRFLRGLGYEIVRFPPPDWLRNRQVLMVLLPRLEINCVLDVGANKGQFGRFLRSCGFKGRIVSFEPVPESFRVLSEHAARDGNWSVKPFALGSRSGSFQINVNQGLVFSSFLSPLSASQEQFPANRIVRTEQVEVHRLDEVYHDCTSDIPSPHIYLKMDTQGFDLEVFRGASGILGSILALQSEVSFKPIYEGMPDYTASLAEYRDGGFEVYDFLVVNRDRRKLGVIEMDCVMIRQDQPPPER